MTTWGFDADATQPGVKLASRSKIHRLNSEICEPELVVHSFAVGAGVILFQGNLHIRVPHEARVSRNLRSRIVKEALKTLETEAPNDSAAQPVVLVLVGDCNLSLDEAEEATQTVQPEDADWRTVWHVHATSEQKGGDLIFVKGAHAKSFDLPFGASHRDRDIWNDSHDAIAIELRVMAEAKPEPVSKRNRTRSDQSERFLAQTDYGFPACE